ncbi:MAG: aldehyde dehydrogenase EutE [Candidatus Eisenbacteria bacterium]|nr:aldehyde dehydrogenase EutE [Candidatus Eisenbacteria bacterium]
MPNDNPYIDAIVDRVLEKLGETPRAQEPRAARRSESGIFDDLDRAILEARRGFDALASLSLEVRRVMIDAMRKAACDAAGTLAADAVSETGMGRAEDKIRKNVLVATKTPGMEILEPWATTGDHGLTLVDHAPYGVIGAIVPSTNPTETVINNGIGMVAGGNTVVFNAHPAARECTNRCLAILNDAAHAAGGPPFVFTAVREPTIATAQAIMKHPEIALLVVTGGPGVVAEAMRSGKRVVAAGPGNPPAVIDETADLRQAARDLVLGASLDNNIVCTDEKEVLCVASAADRLKEEMRGAGAYEIEGAMVSRLKNLVLAEDRGPGAHSVVEKSLVGRDAGRILDALGVRGHGDPRLILVEVPGEHTFVWTELLIPVLPVVRVPNVDAAIDLACRAEHGFRHTASMHSRNIDKLSKMARVMNTSIFVKNGPNYAGLGFGGEGYTSFTIASPTGDGLTNARTFTRPRRCVLVDRFRIV